MYIYILESSAPFARASGPGLSLGLSPGRWWGPAEALGGPWDLVGLSPGLWALPWALVEPCRGPGPSGGLAGALPGPFQICK